MPDFRMQQNFPISSVISAAQTNVQLQQQARQAGNESLLAGLKSIGDIGASLHAQKQQVAQALALGKLTDVDPELARVLEPAQVIQVAKLKMSGGLQDLLSVDPASGDVSTLGQIRKGSKVVMPQRLNPQQSQFTTESGQPLIFDPRTQSYKPATVGTATSSTGGTAVLKKGDAAAITDATLLANQEPNIKRMFDAYRSSKNPRLQSTPAGRLMDPTGKQAENSLKLAAFTFGGKNLTGQEKDVVFGALFPSWTDDEQSRSAKEQLLTNYISGKIDLMQAANLLGPAGSKLRQTLAKYQEQALPKGANAVAQPANVQAPPPAPAPSPDLAHLSTAELMDLRKKMTAHKEEKK